MSQFFSHLLTLFSCFIISHSLNLGGYQIKDLTTNGLAFKTEAASWTNTGIIGSSPVYVCSGTSLLGGYNILSGTSGKYFKKTYNNIPPHNMLYYSLSFWAIDTWDNGDSFQLQFDSHVINAWNNINFKLSSAFLCGQSTREDIGAINIVGRIPHSNSSLTLKVISQLDQVSSDESFGFRNITFTFINTTNIQPATFCGRSNITLQNNQCPCSIDEYLSPSNGSTCSLCSSGCGLCFSSAPQDCIQCQSGYYFDVIHQRCTACSANCSTCHGPDPSQCDACESGKYKYWNGSCLADCALPLEVVMSGSDLLCNFPCNNFEAFLYWDGFCSSVCPLPLKERIGGGRGFCEYNCSLNQYLYENGTCSDICELPLLKETFHNRSFCQHPCPNATDFIYWNDTCQETCPAPYRVSVEDSLFYCEKSCQIDQFLYEDGSCNDTCPFPFVVRIEVNESLVQYCDAPCPTDKIVLWDKSCVDSCEAPMRQVLIENFTTCQPPCADPFNYYYYPETGECQSECKAPYIISDNSLYLSCSSVLNINSSEISIGNTKNPDKTTTQTSLTMNHINSITATVVDNGILLDTLTSMTSNPAVTTMIIYIKLLQYIRYLDISFPLRLATMLKEQIETKSSLTFGPSLSEKAAEGFKDYLLPFVFERYNHYSSFLVNLCKFFSTLFILSLLSWASKGLRIMNKQKKWGLLSKILDKFEAVVKWNYILILVIANISDIILYSSFEFRTLHIHSAQAVLSFLCSLISVFGVFGFLFIAWFFPQKVYIVQKKIQFDCSVESIFLEKWKGFEMLWTGFTLEKLLPRLFLFIYIMRIAIVYLIASYLFVSPLAQTILYLLISLGSVVYLVKSVPLKSKMSRFQVLTYESIVLGINIGLLFIAIFDASGIGAAQVRLFIGDVIIFGHILFNFVGILFLGMKLGKKVIDICEKYKKRSEKLKIGLEKLLTVPVGPQNKETLESRRESIHIKQGDSPSHKGNSQSEEKPFRNQPYQQQQQRGVFLANNHHLHPFVTSRKSSFYANSPRNNLSLNETYGFESGTTTPRIRFNMKEVGFSPRVDENEEVMSYREGEDSNRTGGMDSNRRLLIRQRIRELRKGSIFEKTRDDDIEVESVRAFENDEGNLSVNHMNKSEIGADSGKENNLSLDFTPRSLNRVFKTDLVNALSNLKFEVKELEDENENSMMPKMEISFKKDENFDADFSFHHA